MQEMTLKEVCSVLGITRRAVQCYEHEGLVTATGKNKYGYLLYDVVAINRIREIKLHQDFGFGLKEIKVLFEVTQQEYVELMRERLVKMKKQLVEMEANIVIGLRLFSCSNAQMGF